MINKNVVKFLKERYFILQTDLRFGVGFLLS